MSEYKVSLYGNVGEEEQCETRLETEAWAKPWRTHTLHSSS